MKKFLLVFSAVFIFQSCIPLRIAPDIKNYKVTRGKKFKRSLSKRQMFIFEDPKDANEFYNYVNTKFHLSNVDVYDDVPFTVENEQYFFAWYETQILDKTLNLSPILADITIHALLDSDEFNPLLSNGANTVDRKGNWYIALEVYSDSEKDCLAESALSRETILKYLRAIKQEYLTTQNYNEIVFKN